MNIEDLTIKQARELVSLFGNTEQKQSSLLKKYIGKCVIVRSRNEGVNFGEVVEIDNTGVVLKDARRLYYHKPKNKEASWYEGVSIYGLSKDSRISHPVEEKAIIEDYSITVCSENAIESLKTHNSNEQS